MSTFSKRFCFFLAFCLFVGFKTSFAYETSMKDRRARYYADPYEQEALMTRIDERIEKKLSVAPQKRLIALILCNWLGCFGAHRFYVGKIGTGILQLLTFGGFGIWAFIDLLIILFGEFKNDRGQKLIDWV